MPEGRVFHFSVDLDKELQKTILHDIFVTENRNAHTFRVKIIRSGAAVDLSGASVSGTFSRYKTRETVAIPSGSVEGEFVVLTLPPECYNIKTAFCLIINVMMGGMTLSVFAGEGNMLLNRFDRIDNTGGVIPSLGELLAQIDAMKTATDRANAGADRVEQLQIDASGLAGDSNKLGGKPPEYYLPAVNLLGNPDFAIAQAGYNEKHGNELYHADRWWGNGAGTLSVSGDVKTFASISGFAIMKQKLWNDGRDHGKTYTLVVTLPDGTRLAGSGVSPSAASTGEQVFIDITAPDNRCWFMAMKGENDVMFVRVDASQIGASVSFLHLDLFEGVYTAENAPVHVPRSYAAELAECQRYYENSWFGAAKTDLFQMIGSCWNGSHFDVPVEFKQQKRTNPSMNYFPSGGRTTVQAFIKSAYRDVTILDPEYRMGLRGVYARVRVAEADLTIGYTYQLHAHWEACADL